MKSNIELRLTGSGGQGVILGSIILAQAALNDKKYAVQSQSYGPEARGGMCKAEVIIGQNEIDFPKVEKADMLLALTQSALDKFSQDIDKNAIILVDSGLKPPANCNARIVSVPILETALNVLHNPVTANIIAVGAINELMHLFDEKVLEQAVIKYLPKSAFDINRTALLEGKKMIKKARI